MAVCSSVDAAGGVEVAEWRNDEGLPRSVTRVRIGGRGSGWRRAGRGNRDLSSAVADQPSVEGIAVGSNPMDGDPGSANVPAEELRGRWLQAIRRVSW